MNITSYCYIVISSTGIMAEKGNVECYKCIQAMSISFTLFIFRNLLHPNNGKER